MPSSRGSSQPRDWTEVSCIADRFFYRLSHQVSPRTQEWVVGLLHVRLVLYQLSYRVSFSLCFLSLKSHKIIWNGNFNNMLVNYQFSCSVMSNSLWPHGLTHTRLPCPSPTARGCSNSCPLSQWCHPTISSSVILFSSCLQLFLVSGSFPMSQSFASCGQNIGASVSVLLLNIQEQFP